MGGLGPVDQSGRLLRPGFSCRVDFTQAQVEYAGLAPGYAGVYQVNVRVPDVSGPNATLTCGWDVETQAVAAIWISR